MKKFVFLFSIVILIAIVICSLIYTYFVRLDSNFWKNAVGNLLATLIGLAAGVPVGFGINRYLESAQIEKCEVEKHKKELEILESIKEEIEFCLNNIFLTPGKDDVKKFLGTPYRTNIWDAFCASAEIKYISSSKLLAQIAHAYHYIKAEDKLEYEALIAFNANRIVEGINLRINVQALDPQFIDQVDKALKGINLKIENLSLILKTKS